MKAARPVGVVTRPAPELAAIMAKLQVPEDRRGQFENRFRRIAHKFHFEQAGEPVLIPAKALRTVVDALKRYPPWQTEAVQAHFDDVRREYQIDREPPLLPAGHFDLLGGLEYLERWQSEIKAHRQDALQARDDAIRELAELAAPYVRLSSSETSAFVTLVACAFKAGGLDVASVRADVRRALRGSRQVAQKVPS